MNPATIFGGALAMTLGALAVFAGGGYLGALSQQSADHTALLSCLQQASSVRHVDYCYVTATVMHIN